MIFKTGLVPPIFPVPVHMVHQTSEPLALLATQLTNAELSVVFCNFLFSSVTEGSFQFQHFLRYDLQNIL